MDDGINWSKLFRELHQIVRDAVALTEALQRHPDAKGKIDLGIKEEPESNMGKSTQERVEWHLENVFPDRRYALEWAVDRIHDIRKAIKQKIYERDEEVVTFARALLAETDQVSVLNQRITRDLERKLAIYRSLQRRPLAPAADPARNEATDRDEPAAALEEDVVDVDDAGDIGAGSRSQAVDDDDDDDPIADDPPGHYHDGRFVPDA